jgi:cell division protease FtsH
MMSTSLRNFTIWPIILLLTLGAIVGLLSLDQRPVSYTTFSQFLHEVDQGNVRDVVIQGPEIHGTYTDGRGFSTVAPNDPALVQRLFNKQIAITARPVQDVPWYVSLVISWMPFIVLMGVWMYLVRRLQGGLYKRYTMSDVRIDDPKHWRDKAEEARAAAEQLTDPESRRQLMDIAVGYEQLALKIGRGAGASEK